MHSTEVADRVDRLAHANVNCHLIDDDEEVILVDGGLPSIWKLLLETLERLNHRPDKLRALVFNHGHFDPLGIARRARAELDIPVLVHPDDVSSAARPFS